MPLGEQPVMHEQPDAAELASPEAQHPETALARIRQFLTSRLGVLVEAGTGAAVALTLAGDAPALAAPDRQLVEPAPVYDHITDAAVHAKKKNCPPGHIQFSLAGSRTVSPDTPAHYTLAAKDCKTPKPTTLRNVQLEETGPGGQHKAWKIKQFHDGTTKKESFTLPASAEPAASGTQAPLLRAIAKGKKVLGRNQWKLNYAAQGQPGSSQSPGNGYGGAPGAQPPGVYLNGPTTVKVSDGNGEYDYSYQVEVMPAKSYANTAVFFSVPESDTTYRNETGPLTAFKPWTEEVTTHFNTADLFATYGIGISVVSAPTKNTRPEELYRQNFPLTLASPSS